MFPVGQGLLGRVFDAFGKPLDRKDPIAPEGMVPLYAKPPAPLERPRIDEMLDVGVRAVNGLLTLGKGQRIGIMAGSGVGKSTLMGMMARYTEADVNVMGLIGERGREVLEFMEKDLGPEGMARSVVIVGHLGSVFPRAYARCLCGHGRGGIFPGSGQGRSAHDGFRDALCHGFARSGTCHGRTAYHQGLYAFGVRPASASA